jgi:hypothetical protein
MTSHPKSLFARFISNTKGRISSSPSFKLVDIMNLLAGFENRQIASASTTSSIEKTKRINRRIKESVSQACETKKRWHEPLSLVCVCE